MFFSFLHKKTKADLVIYDDVFPSELSPFRYTEYTGYLQHFPNSAFICSGKSLCCFPNSPSVQELCCRFIKTHSNANGKMFCQPDLKRVQAKLIYVTFLHNAIKLRLGTKQKTPFIIQLYPGGGFQLHSPGLDKEMKKIFSSSYCKKVIVTQQTTLNYLTEKNLCPGHKIAYIFGVVTPEKQLNTKSEEKNSFGKNKSTLDICFTSHKYMPLGKDKGYDVFIESAKILAKKFDFLRFHVVGSFTEQDYDVTELKDKITFYGLQKTDWFAGFYKNIDIFCSPNRPFTLLPGGFDGFPTACATEAGLQGAALFVADELNSNANQFTPDKDIVIIRPDPKDLANKISAYIKKPDELRQIGRNGARKIKKLYSLETQMKPRIEIIKTELEKLK